MYNEINTIHDKDRFEMQLTEDVLQSNFTTKTAEGAQKFLENLIGYYIIMEGIFFYSGFVMILSFHRQNKMTGIGEQFQYILRDETIHLNFGIDLINGIKEENPEFLNIRAQRQFRLGENLFGCHQREWCLSQGLYLNVDRSGRGWWRH